MDKRDKLERAVDHHNGSKAYFRGDLMNNIRLGAAGVSMVAVGAAAEAGAVFERSAYLGVLGLGSLAVGGFLLKDAKKDITESIDALVEETEIVARLEQALEQNP